MVQSQFNSNLLPVFQIIIVTLNEVVNPIPPGLFWSSWALGGGGGGGGDLCDCHKNSRLGRTLLPN